ncbi:MAG: GNAT family N-acetyltransferase [Candidatus Cloacimonetes bacterium]|nr:GNAT family N-acetyltransferase [Candidatus Cloacimonadota bacterium]
MSDTRFPEKAISIAPLKESYIQDVCYLLEKCYTWLAEEEGFSEPAKNFLIKVRGSKATIRRESQTQKYFIALKEDHIVGIVSIRNNEVTKLYVDPLFHKTGIGRKLFEKAETEITQDGYDEMKLVTLGSSAIPFYTAMGMMVQDRKQSRVEELSGIVGTVMIKQIA